MDGQKSDELSENGENSNLETEFTNKPSGSKQVDGSSYVGDQVHCTEPKNVFPSEVKFDTSGNVSNASARGRYMLAKLRQQQLKEELELDTQRRLLKAKNEVELAKLQMELEDIGDSEYNDVKVHDDTITFGKVIKECKSPDISLYHSGVERVSSARTTVSVGKIDLPKVELQYFDGNPREYWKFVRQFENYIESRVTDEGQRLLYLVNYCKGRAKKAVEECCLLPVELGYKRAREILRELFGQDYVVARSLIDNLFDDLRPVVFNGDALTHLAIKMQGCEIALSQMDCEADLNALDTLERLVRLLPQPLRIRWARAVDEGLDRPRFSDLRAFIMREARIARSRFGSIAVSNGHSFQNTVSVRNNDKRRSEVRNFHINKHVSDDSHRCFVCIGVHKLDDCPTFLSYSVPARWNCLRKNRGCFVCLAKGHRVSECRSLVRCTSAGCTGKHHNLLHSATPAQKVEANVVNCNNVGCKPETRLKVLPVGINGPNGLEFVYALIDSGSDVSLVERDLLIRLGIEEKPTDLKISTVNGLKSISSGVCKLLLTSLDQSETITVNRAFSIEKVSVRTSCHSLAEAASYWPHLSNIPFGDIPDRRVKLLIGTDVPEAHWVEEQRKGDKGEPFAVKSLLGWMILGRSVIDDVYVNSVNATTIYNDDLSEQLKLMYNNEFADTRSTAKGLSLEDKLALQAASSSIRLVDGHYEVGLPWRQRNTSLGDNRHLALRRLLTLRTRFTRDSGFYENYTRAIMQNAEKGYAEPAPMVPSDGSSLPRWYLPHHAVVNPKKPEKFRVVFDCAAKYNGLSLNDMLYSGPDVTTNLADVLLRFRADRVAMAADIEEMFMQVKVPPGDREFLRFLWWRDNDISKSIVEYRMTVHPFGATSSPFCANYALRQAAEELGNEYPDDVKEVVTENFYVDDLLVSLSSIDDARKLAGNLSDLLKKAGFHLRKWISNFPQAFSKLPIADLSQSNVNLAAENACIERTLGLHWNPVADQFRFTFTQTSKEITRRSMLATIASLYDPLGLIGPILLPAKLLLQGLCRQGLTWDDPLPQDDVRNWEAWLKEMSTISNLKIPRCVKSLYSPNNPIQLHVFCDASEVGYGAVVYCRYTSSIERYYCTLVIAKSRVAPLKQISIPRLELSAAQLGVRLGESARRCMAVPIDSLTFWTDSTIVLYYIRNRQTRFSTFVANRLSTIHDHSRVEQWRYISSKSNPADLASRGVKRCQDLEYWLEGPQFLRLNEASWPSDGPDFEAVVGLELKRELVNVNFLSECTAKALLTYYSDWTRLLRSVIWLTRFKTHIMSLRNRGNVSVINGPLRVIEWKQAEKDVVRMVQKEVFPHVREGCGCDKHSLAKLCPIVIDDIICVGGRLSYRSTSYVSKHPPILPKQHNVTDMIVRYYHLLEGHSGVAHVLASIRRRFWIVKGGATIKRIIGKCLKCRRQLAVPTSQLMAPLPLQRVETGWHPFNKVGLDYFGPFGVKRARSVEKRYGCIFTCLQTRAVHFEVSYGLTTDSFIMALMRFVARRGTPTEIFSDNGSNFVGAAKELGVIIRSFDQTRITTRLTPLEIQWHFQPVASSHRGGVWERLIRSCRRILTAIVGEQTLTDETLHTFLLEVERILNNRPLVPCYDDIRDAEALTPNHLVLLRGNIGLELEGSFADQFRRGFRQASYLAGVFWARWSREYLPILQARQKWFSDRRDLCKGDLVMIVTESLPRGRWPLGIVVEKKYSQDDKVRLVTVRTAAGLVTRDIRKICLLEGELE